MSTDDYSMSLSRANLISLVLFIPISALILAPYALRWGWGKTGGDLLILYQDPLLFVLLMVGGIVAHELLHGVTWMVLGNRSWQDIKFGVNWKAFAPYAHCREPLEVNAYRWGAAMPGLVLGVIPYLVSIVTGYAWLMLFGYLLTITASGDLLILWAIRKLEAGTLVIDHPERAGCQVVNAEA